MAAQAVADGIPLRIRSAYRSESRQADVFKGWARQVGRKKALRVSARAGHSEHQLGTTIDFARSADAPWDGNFAATPTGRWLARNAAEFGFVMSYPKGASSVTCYAAEPWHFRWIGRARARTWSRRASPSASGCGASGATQLPSDPSPRGARTSVCDTSTSFAVSKCMADRMATDGLTTSTVQRAAAGNEAAFAALVAEHHAAMARVAYVILGDRDAAQDAVQSHGRTPGDGWAPSATRRRSGPGSSPSRQTRHETPCGDNGGEARCR